MNGSKDPVFLISERFQNGSNRWESSREGPIRMKIVLRKKNFHLFHMASNR